MDKIKISTLLLTLVLLMICSNLFSQQFPQWGNLKPGKYSVGYKDTIFIKNDEKFRFYETNEYKPFYVCIWYPAINRTEIPEMTYRNYWDFERPDKYNQLYDSLITRFTRILISDAICKDIKTYSRVAFDTLQKKLLEDVWSTKVNAKKNLAIIKGNLPCILYHHGAQSTPNDNNVFCEFMASQGYLVVSSNYNLPADYYEGLTATTDENGDFASDIKFVLNQTKKSYNLDTNNIFAVGHSMGAQDFIKSDTAISKPFKEIISFHTTLEDRSIKDANKIWPEIMTEFKNNHKKMTTPTVLFAPIKLSQKDTLWPEYRAFKKNTTTPYTFITVKYPQTHDGFITLGNLRFPYCNKYNLNDKNEIHTLQKSYENIVLYSSDIINNTVNNKTNVFESEYAKFFKIELKK
ncbi:MAG: Tetratricopeptide 2 repeat protein [Bacteroidetes bacterium]|jgi:esterase/lipase|nr:Tetratricopeptide 2 repeat protein [Bacteroidota bacterium]